MHSHCLTRWEASTETFFDFPDRRNRFEFMNIVALKQIVISRLIEYTREPEVIFWVYVFPLIMTLTLGLAFRGVPVEKIKVDVVEGDQSAKVVEQLSGDEKFVVTQGTIKESLTRLKTGKTEVVLDAGKEGTANYAYHFDPTRPGSILAKNSVDDRLQRTAGRKDLWEAKEVKVDEKGSRYIDFLVPGLIGMSIMGGGMFGMGLAIVDLRIRKVLKRFLATPMNRSDFLFGMLLSRLIFMIPEFAVMLLFAWLVFGVTSQGGSLPVMFLIVLGSLQFAGIGLLVASRAKTMESISGLLNLVMLPMWIASGIFFSADNFPEVVQPVLRVLPLTPLIRCLRGVMLEGTPVWEMGLDLALIVVWGLVSFVVALKIFRWS